MFNLDVVIPSLGRIKKLENCLNSIFHSAKNIKINIYLYFSVEEEYKYFLEKFKDFPEITVILLTDYRVPTFWNTHLKNMKASALMYLNDDVLLFEDTLSVVMSEFPKTFPDGDGVLGLRQSNIPQDQAVEGAFGVIGKKYAERFPDSQVFCPSYYRFFGDFELWRYAKSIDKFLFCIPARIQHLHPAFSKEQEDETHRLVRKWLPTDRQTFKLRQSKNLLWGDSFIL
jgi:hypothetical protein